MRKAQPYRPPQRPAPPRSTAVDAAADVDNEDELRADAAAAGEIPLWQRDTITLSARARRLLERIKPVIVQVLAFWDHRVTRLTIGDRTLTVDSSGSYRID